MSARYPMLQSVVPELISVFIRLELTVTPGSCHQLMHAALGSIAPEVAAKNNLPIQLRASSIDDGRLQYNLYETIQRAKKCLKLEEQMATRVAVEVIRVLQEARISVNQAQLFLDLSISKQTKKEYFKALLRNLQSSEGAAMLQPQTATLAIEAGLIPSPDITWQPRFALAASFPSRDASRLVELVCNNVSYFWPFPPAWNRATDAATLNHYFSAGQKGAEIGMGFTIIQEPWPRDKYPRLPDGGVFSQYTLSTPIWYYHGQAGKWGLGNILKTRINKSSKWFKEQLETLLPGGVESLPRIYGCRQCKTLFVDQVPSYPNVPTKCSCVEAPSV